jgi:hypothetical protein
MSSREGDPYGSVSCTAMRHVEQYNNTYSSPTGPTVLPLPHKSKGGCCWVLSMLSSGSPYLWVAIGLAMYGDIVKRDTMTE